MAANFKDVSNADFECPFGVTEHNLESRGVGDTLAKTIHVLTFGLVKPCDDCRKRQAWLNKHAPYKKKRKRKRAANE